MRRLTLHAGLIGLLLVVFGAGSYAVANGGKRHIKSERMTGYQEVPALSSVAEGQVRGDGSTTRRTRSTTRSRTRGLEAPVAQSHIHFGQRSVNGGISVWLCERHRARRRRRALPPAQGRAAR